jgi:hypothetical protein
VDKWTREYNKQEIRSKNVDNSVDKWINIHKTQKQIMERKNLSTVSTG